MNSDSLIPDDKKITQVKDNLSSSDSKLQRQEEAIVERIPIYEEEFDVTKEITETQLYLEKRWIKSTKKIEVPINYEEMFINGKEFDAYSHNELVEVFSKVKEKISEVFHPSQTEGDENQPGKAENGDNRHYPNDLDIKLQKDKEPTKEDMNQIEDEMDRSEKRLSLPHSQASTNDSQIQVPKHNNKNSDTEEEQIIPIWGEQIIIDKKMVKLGEIVVKKSKITEKRNVDIEVRKEKATVKYPDGRKEEFT